MFLFLTNFIILLFVYVILCMKVCVGHSACMEEIRGHSSPLSTFILDSGLELRIFDLWSKHFFSMSLLTDTVFSLFWLVETVSLSSLVWPWSHDSLTLTSQEQELGAWGIIPNFRVIFILSYWDMVSLCSSGWSGLHCRLSCPQTHRAHPLSAWD